MDYVTFLYIINLICLSFYFCFYYFYYLTFIILYSFTSESTNVWVCAVTSGIFDAVSCLVSYKIMRVSPLSFFLNST